MKDEDLFHEMIDRNIEIDVSTLPKSVQMEIEDLEKFHAARDWLNYDLKFDELEMNAKSYIFSGEISPGLYKKLLAKYGGLYD